MELDEHWMKQALKLAQEAIFMGETPIGAVIINKDGKLLAQAYNLRETLEDPTAHAERIALSLAGRALGTWRLEDCTLYVTLEPCAMCAGAIVLSRIKRVVYGATDPKAGACQSLYQITADPRLNHRPLMVGGVLAEECGQILRDFFRSKRQKSQPNA